MPSPLKKSNIELPLGEFKAAGGFPNPCENYLSKPISLDSILIDRPSSTFLFNVQGNSMSPDITDGSIIVVDRFINIKSGLIVLATINNEFVVKRLEITDEKILFRSTNSDFRDIEVKIDPDNSWRRNTIWGVVTGAIKKFI